MTQSLVSPLIAITWCFTIAFLFVLSVYVWSDSIRNPSARSDPKQIQKRSLSTSFFTILSAVGTIFFFYKPLRDFAVINGRYITADEPFFYIQSLSLIGCDIVSLHGIYAAIAGLSVTAVLFLGPLVDLGCQTVRYGLLFGPMEPWIIIRNCFIAPITEEIAFRACMISVLLTSNLSTQWCVGISGACFGLAHLHHLYTHMKDSGAGMWQGVTIVAFQLVYTSIFGVLSSILFLSFNHVAAPIMSHIFCNYMGCPSLMPFIALFRYTMSKSNSNSNLGNFYVNLSICVAYVAGIIGFCYTLPWLSSLRFFQPSASTATALLS